MFLSPISLSVFTVIYRCHCYNKAYVNIKQVTARQSEVTHIRRNKLNHGKT